MPVTDRRGGREGETLKGKYRLEALLGSGGMGEVYRARNITIGRACAIKLLHGEHAASPHVVERFLREAKAANRVRHPHVVEVLDIDTDAAGVPFIVQELLEGDDLAKLIERVGVVPPEVAVTLLLPVVHAVGAAHEAGVVHRDLKPENVFLSRIEGVVVPKVVDFGIAKVLEPEPKSVRLTSTHVIMGSPAYMSPEQIQAPQDVDARSDIWQLGVILYETLSGRRPFDARVPHAIFAKVCGEEPAPLEALAPHLPRKLIAIVERCLSKDRFRRFRDANELALALEEVQRTLAEAPRSRTTVPQRSRIDTSDGAMTGIAPGALVFPDRKPPDPASVEERRTVARHGRWTFRPPPPAGQDHVETAVAGRHPEPVPPAGRPRAGEAIARAAKERGGRKTSVRGMRAAEESVPPAGVELGSIPAPKFVPRETGARVGSMRPVKARDLALSAALVVGVVIVVPLLGGDRWAGMRDALGKLAFLPFAGATAALLSAGGTVAVNGYRARAPALLAAAAALFGCAVCLVAALCSRGLGLDSFDAFYSWTEVVAPWAAAAVAVAFSAHGAIRARDAFRAQPRQLRALGALLIALSFLSVVMGLYAINAPTTIGGPPVP
jgi:serine/threonine-protein kinase